MPPGLPAFSWDNPNGHTPSSSALTTPASESSVLTTSTNYTGTSLFFFTRLASATLFRLLGWFHWAYLSFYWFLPDSVSSMFISTDYIVFHQFHQLLFFVCSTGFTGLTSVFSGFYRTVSSLFISTDYIVPDHFHQLLFFVCSTGFTGLTSVSTGFYWVPLILCPFPPITPALYFFYKTFRSLTINLASFRLLDLFYSVFLSFHWVLLIPCPFPLIAPVRLSTSSTNFPLFDLLHFVCWTSFTAFASVVTGFC